MKRTLTGIKPTSAPHIGNYLGAIRPAIELLKSYQGLYFIADHHALTTVRDPTLLRESIYDVAATWLAAGLDPKETILYRQSDVIEVFELAWVLSCFLATGQLERGHSYKDAIAKGDAPNAGIFNYPVLMAADILLYDVDLVPIGQDQKQHLELCRDVAMRINHQYGSEVLKVPEPFFSNAPLVPGLDGRKMSKSYGNAVPLFASEKELKKALSSIVTGSEALEAPKVAKGSTVFELYKLIASETEQHNMEQKLASGGYGWGHAKLDLFEKLNAELTPKREVYQRYRNDVPELKAILQDGANRAREIARETIARVRKHIGISL